MWQVEGLTEYFFPQLGMAHAYNPSTCEAEARELEVQDQPAI
jgi:hypothetical protein